MIHHPYKSSPLFAWQYLILFKISSLYISRIKKSIQLVMAKLTKYNCRYLQIYIYYNGRHRYANATFPFAAYLRQCGATCRNKLRTSGKMSDNFVPVVWVNITRMLRQHGSDLQQVDAECPLVLTRNSQPRADARSFLISRYD